MHQSTTTTSTVDLDVARFDAEQWLAQCSGYKDEADRHLAYVQAEGGDVAAAEAIADSWRQTFFSALRKCNELSARRRALTAA